MSLIFSQVTSDPAVFSSSLNTDLASPRLVFKPCIARYPVVLPYQVPPSIFVLFFFGGESFTLNWSLDNEQFWGNGRICGWVKRI